MNTLTTFEKAKTAADELFRANIKPSVNKIREKLDGKGGQKTIQDALDSWWKELNEQLTHYQQREGIPEAMFTLTDQLWDSALLHASKKYEQKCADFKITKEQLQKQTEDEINRHKQTKTILDELRIEDETLQQKLKQAFSETQALRQELESNLSNYTLEKKTWESLRLELTVQAKDANLALEIATQKRKHEKELFDGRIAQEQAKLTDLKNQHDTLRTALEKSTENTTNLKKEISDMAIEHKSSQQKISALDKSVIAQDRVIQSHQLKINEKDSIIRERDKELLMNQSSLDVSNSKLALVEDALSEKTELVRELNKHTAALTSFINDSKNDYKKVAAELDIIKAKYLELKRNNKA